MNVLSAVFPTITSPKSSSLSESLMNGYLPTALTRVANRFIPSWNSCSGSTSHRASATFTVASVGVNSHLTCCVSPGARRPVSGAKMNGGSIFHAKSTGTSPSLEKANVLRIVSFTAPYPKSTASGTLSESTGSAAVTRTLNTPHPATLNST